MREPADVCPIFERIKVDAIKTSIRYHISKEDFADYQCTLQVEPVKIIGDILAFEMLAYLSGKKVNEICVDIRYPADWWQAFKERWFPRFLLKRYPVVYKEVHIKEPQFVVCPHIPCEGREVHYEWLRNAEEIKEQLFAG